LRSALSPLNIGFVSALALVWAFAAYEVHRVGADALRDTTQSTVFQSQVFAEYSRSTIRRVDECLQDLRSNYRSDRPEAFAEVVRRQHATVSDISFQVAVIDRHGFLAYTNLAAPAERVDLRDREHYKVHAAHPGADRLYISDPLKGKVSQKWAIQFTRPILHHGNFDGVIVISVGPEQFASFASNLQVAPGDVITMVKDSGRIIARQPALADSFGRSLHSLPYLAPDAPQAGSFRMKAQSDGVDRVYGFHRLPEYGLTAVVGESIDQALAPSQAHRDVTLRVAAVMTLLLGALYHVLRRSIIERQRAEQQRRLSSLVYEASSEGMVVTTADGLIVAVNPAFSTHTGYSAQEAIGQTTAMLKSGRHDQHFYARMWGQISASGHW
jgi:PAS domain-containing protein